MCANQITDIGIEMCVYKKQYLKMFRLKLKKISNFHPFEVVCRGSKTNFQVGEN